MWRGWRPGVEVTHPIGEGRGVYAYLIDGAATFDGEAVCDRRCRQGDRSAVSSRSGPRSRAS